MESQKTPLLNSDKDYHFKFANSHGVDGHLTIPGNRSHVAVVGSRIEGKVSIDKIHQGCHKVIIALAEVANVWAGDAMQLDFHTWTHTLEHALGKEQPTEAGLLTLTNSITVDLDSVDAASVNKHNPHVFDFSIDVPAGSAPTVFRGDYVEEENFTGVVSAEVSCQVIVAIEEQGAKFPKIIGSKQLFLISNSVPKHLKEELGWNAEGHHLREWSTKLTEGQITLKLMSPNSHIGERMQFSVETTHPKGLEAIKGAHLIERLLVSRTNASGKSLAELALPSTSSAEEKAKYPAWSHVTEGEKRRAPSAVFQEGENSVIGLFLDDIMEPMHGITKEDNLVHFSFLIPAEHLVHQSVFSLRNACNFYMVVLDVEDDGEVHLGPIPVTWSSKLNANDVVRPEKVGMCTLL